MIRLDQQQQKPGQEPDVWQWAKLTQIDPAPFSTSIDLPDLASRGDVVLTLDFRGLSSLQPPPKYKGKPPDDHSVVVDLNGKSVATLTLERPRRGAPRDQAARIGTEGARQRTHAARAQAQAAMGNRRATRSTSSCSTGSKRTIRSPAISTPARCRSRPPRTARRSLRIAAMARRCSTAATASDAPDARIGGWPLRVRRSFGRHRAFSSARRRTRQTRSAATRRRERLAASRRIATTTSSSRIRN